MTAVGERSHGKARPALPRASDLQPVTSDRKPTDGRGPGGRFAPGNRVSVGAGVKATQKKLLGDKDAQGDEGVVRRDAWRIFTATMRTMPVDLPPVRSLASLHARHVALAAFYGSKAAEMGLATPEGMKLQEASDKQSQRAERVLVTALDVARTLAETAKDKRETTVALIERRLAAPPPMASQVIDAE